MTKDVAETSQRSPVRISQAMTGFRKKLRGDGSRKKITDKLKENLRKHAKKKYFVTIA